LVHSRLRLSEHLALTRGHFFIYPACRERAAWQSAARVCYIPPRTEGDERERARQEDRMRA